MYPRSINILLEKFQFDPNFNISPRLSIRFPYEKLVIVVEGRVEVVSRDKESRKSAKDGIVAPRLVCIVSGYIYTEAVVVKGPSVPGRKVGKGSL